MSATDETFNCNSKLYLKPIQIQGKNVVYRGRMTKAQGEIAKKPSLLKTYFLEISVDYTSFLPMTLVCINLLLNIVPYYITLKVYMIKSNA